MVGLPSDTLDTEYTCFSLLLSKSATAIASHTPVHLFSFLSSFVDLRWDACFTYTSKAWLIWKFSVQLFGIGRRSNFLLAARLFAMIRKWNLKCSENEIWNVQKMKSEMFRKWNLKCSENEIWNVQKMKSEMFRKWNLKCSENEIWNVQKMKSEMFRKWNLKCSENEIWNVQKMKSEMFRKWNLKCSENEIWNVQQMKSEMFRNEIWKFATFSRIDVDSIGGLGPFRIVKFCYEVFSTKMFFLLVTQLLQWTSPLLHPWKSPPDPHGCFALATVSCTLSFQRRVTALFLPNWIVTKTLNNPRYDQTISLKCHK